MSAAIENLRSVESQAAGRKSAFQPKVEARARAAGGNNLDGTPAPIRALPAIAEAAGPQMTVMLDGGVRRGTDVVRALALGAKAVLVGRPYMFGLAAGGEAGPGGLVTFTTTASPDDVVAFYRERAEKAGLRSVAGMNQGDTRAYGAAADAGNGASLQVVATPTETGVTSVQLGWSAGQ